ncbi:hypothetical protein A2703_01375 [Candidatus Collierbacteria bacterium RIFCSPHIGHO2_01_FULL_50_25]|uniref:Phosphoglycerate kinase n=1 Tax=Candidatus Collierbacteria bacterium RIFCSPHIGHO2_01_FULL_50_25 TaxID=1817722 RepID=A0A1F5EUM4_9BACT|nr:MAG: hypothetical protein A2703_01375 [Candidatus Collierbacteria bacterium RIFCSPHIGHO2_01_FULL_50_25]
MLNPDILRGKNVLLRADLDVPLEQGKVVNDFRLRALLPTLRLCLTNAQSTLITGHLGRPEAKSEEFGLKPVREWLEKALHRSIYFIDSGFSPGEWARGEFPLAMLDNLRFDPGELNNSREFARELTQGSDIYVYEAFASYNSAASLRIIPEIIPTYTGLQFDREVEELEKIVKSPVAPSLLVLSGAKEDKGEYVDNLVDKFDEILVGGKLASHIQPQTNVLPASLTPDGLDIDDASARLFSEKIKAAKSVVISGPLGRFEDGIHIVGTKAIFSAAVHSPARNASHSDAGGPARNASHSDAGGPARVIIGGGDTLAAIPALGFAYSDFDFVSTGGGAMLEFLATGTHPLLTIIRNQTHAGS